MEENVIILNVDNIYEAMERDDRDVDYLSNIVMTALEPMQRTKFPEERKNTSESESYREEGNAAYKNGLLQKALMNYNKALAYAPNGSLSLKLAYSNRSAVLFAAKEFKACEQDCITALAIDCPTLSSLTEKLELRKSLAGSELKKRNIAYQQDKNIFQNFAEDYFKLKSQNCDIPCASADVEVVIESGIPKVVASRDIPAGTLVAFEKAFVSWAPESDQYISCYYCRKLDFNLFPCGGCVVALFCSKQCEESCMVEYHTHECQIAGSVFPVVPGRRWIIRAVIKLRNMCASWEEMISMSYDFGYKKIKNGNMMINDIYDVNKPSSILSFKNNRHFFYGAVYNYAISCALFLRVSQNMQSFLPQDREDKLLAMKAIARIFMYLGIYGIPTVLALAIKNAFNDTINYHRNGHFGLFSFLGKLEQSCMPNLQTLTVNSSIALVTSEQIKVGTELTVSHVTDWLQYYSTKNQRILLMYNQLHTFCTCIICKSTPEDLKKKTEMSATQKKAIKKCFTFNNCRTLGYIHKCFGQIYKALDCLDNIRFSADYSKVYIMLVDLQLNILYNKLKNTTLSEEY